MVEQVKQSLGEKPVQTLENESESEKPCRKRSVEEKVGRLKYHEVLTKRLLVQSERILDELRWIRHRLRALGECDVDVPMVERFAVKDEVDLEIMQLVREAGVAGVFPKDVAKHPALAKYGLEYYDVSRRIVRMNKRLRYEVGELLFEKRGHRWALTRFAFDRYGETDVGNGQKGGEF